MNDSDARRRIMAEVAARLRPVCAEWPQDVFDEMVERLTDITMRYERDFGLAYDRRSTDRLVADLKHALERRKSTRLDSPPESE